jgi:hypothetical protein
MRASRRNAPKIRRIVGKGAWRYFKFAAIDAAKGRDGAAGANFNKVRPFAVGAGGGFSC